MAVVSLPMNLPLDRINHCMLCDQAPEQNASLTLRYVPSDSLLVKLFGPVVRNRRLLYLLRIPGFIGLVVLFVYLIGRLESLGDLACWLIFLFMLTLTKFLAAFLSKRMRMEVMQTHAPLCESHLYSMRLFKPMLSGSIDLHNLRRSTGLQRVILFELGVLGFLIGMAFLAAVFAAPDSNAPLNLLMTVFGTAFFFAVVNSLYLNWHRSKVFFWGIWDETSQSIQIDGCSEEFAVEVQRLSEFQSTFAPIVVTPEAAVIRNESQP